MLIRRPVSKNFSIERPLFIVSAPCAGTGPVFELLSRARHVCTLSNASRNELRARLESNDITAGEIQALVRDGLRGPGRWLSAIVANARQIPLLNEACPDALFIYVHRNAPEQLARMMLDGHSEGAWAETTARIMNDLAALPARRWCAVDIDAFLADRPREAALLGRFADLKWRVRPGPAQKRGRRASVAKAAAVPELARDAAIFARANHASWRDLPEKNFWRSLPENVAKAVVSGRLAASLTVGAVAVPAAANAATLTVTNTQNSGDGSLRGQVVAANPGDTINFDPSLDGQTITLQSNIKITVPLTIQGPGSGKLTIDGGGTPVDGGLSGGSGIFYLYMPIPDGGTPETVTISGLTLQHGTTGGIAALYAHLIADDLVVTDNLTLGGGGGVLDYGGGLTLSNSSLSGNFGHGGGLFLAYAAVPSIISGTTISGNTAVNYPGAGIYLNNNFAPVTFENCTVASNAILSVEVDGGTPVANGGGFSTYGTELTIAESTIAGNTATGVGGGFYSLGGTNVTIVNSILAGNTAPAGNDAYTNGNALEVTYSLIQSPGTASFIDADGGFGDGGMIVGAGNITGEDPLLGPLANNGGPTETMLPGAGSPVINAGDPNFDGDPPTDQRGDTRVFGGRIDMGSVEVGASPYDAGPGPVTDAGTIESTDAGTKTTTTTGKGCNCNGSGDAALALLTPIGLLLMRRRRRAV